MSVILNFFGWILNSGTLIPGLALSFGFVVAYLLLAARNVVPMTTPEIELLWKFHKQKDCCKAKTWSEIKKKNELIGFECKCGHKHIQKKPLINLS